MSDEGLKQLHREWRRKLRASGFEDIELPDGSLLPMKKPPGRWRSFDKAHDVEREAVASYFRQATTFCESSRFKRLALVEKKVWRLHAQGLSNSEVASRLNVSLKKVRNAIRSARLLAGLPEVTSSIGHGRQDV